MNRILEGLIRRTRLITHRSEQVGAYPAGHYYSPIPLADDVRTYVKSRQLEGEPLGIELNEQAQYELLDEYARFYEELPFPEKQTIGHRYYYDNDWFGYSDAIFLYCFLRKRKPKKIIEVGSGYSSAVTLDTVDRFFSQRPEITFIDPYPVRLLSLLTEGDQEHVRLIDQKIQDVPVDLLLTLESGDLLFIDSSHVVKCGSDLQMLLFEILPRLKPGVFVHFHDVFYPFDYPSEWLEEGRYWNEAYFLRAFLSYNSAWRIEFFNTFVNHRFAELITATMPLCRNNLGGSLYIQRKE